MRQKKMEKHDKYFTVKVTQMATKPRKREVQPYYG